MIFSQSFVAPKVLPTVNYGAMPAMPFMDQVQPLPIPVPVPTQAGKIWIFVLKKISSFEFLFFLQILSAKVNNQKPSFQSKMVVNLLSVLMLVKVLNKNVHEALSITQHHSDANAVCVCLTLISEKNKDRFFSYRIGSIGKSMLTSTMS